MEIRMNINGHEIYAQEGQTILLAARDNGIEIPNLCHDDRVKMYGSCGVCVVEVEGMPRLVRACSTMAADGMVINTQSARARETRKAALELLLSDHTGDCRPPCVLACPGQTDCQGYVGLIANGEYKEAAKLVKDKIPLPGAIGRVCPHPCEDACRRRMVEEPVAIADLKRFLGDFDLYSGDPYTAPAAPDTGKRVAVVGGGPGGLSAGYYLRARGHEVDIYDMMPEMGGMLWYGIPEYRLPKEYLKKEIEVIEKTGVRLHNNIRIGRDLTLSWLRESFDAVIVAVGAWSSAALRCPGEDMDGVIGGIDFLRGVAGGDLKLPGRRIAVVGGGNTAMDACRTAVRLGAEKVYNIYRRTRNEMPAEEIEIVEAEEEGVEFKFLTNPIEVQGENGKVGAMRLQIMELGEPDASGRRAPVPVEGAEEIIEVDAVIVAIGQKLDPDGLAEIDLTKWRTISADEATFRTNLPGVFAIGDATNKGADIAIAAIGEAKRAAQVIDRFLFGEDAAYAAPYLVRSEPTAEDFASYGKIPKEKMPHRRPAERKDNFLEVNYGLTEEQAKRDAARCLECGCHDYFECKLYRYANDYKSSEMKPEKYAGKVHNRPVEDDHPFIHRNPDKCILCGLCVRVCDEVVGATALGLVSRGFDAVVAPALNLPLNQTDCISCGQCVHVCPTGALTETMQIMKQVPTAEESVLTTCSFCSVGCKTKLTYTGGSLLRSLPAADRPENALLCMKGRFGFGEIAREPRLTAPLVSRGNGGFREVDYSEAFTLIAKKLQAVAALYGPGSVGVSVSDRYTNEQAGYIRDYAMSVLGTENIFSFGRKPSGLADALGRDASTADFEELTATGLVLLVESDLNKPHGVAGMLIRKAVQNGAKLINLNTMDTPADEICAARHNPGDDLSFLRGVYRLVLEQSPAAKKLPGYEEALASVADISPCDDAKRLAADYLAAKKAVIVFEQAKLSRQAAQLLASIALAAGKAQGARNGLIQLKPGANSQGLADLGVKAVCDVDTQNLRALVIFGEDVDIDAFGLEKLEFLAVQDLHMTRTAGRADVVIPGESFAETTGTFTSSVGKTGQVRRALPALAPKDTFAVVDGLAKAVGRQVKAAAECACAQEPRLLPAANAPLHEGFVNTNALYNSLLSFAAARGL